MPRPQPSRTARIRMAQPGLTLTEVMVGLAMVAVLAAVVLPNVMAQVRRAEVAQWRNDLQSVGKAARLFRLHLRRWPSGLGQLVARPDTGATDLAGAPIPAKFVDEWRGPYLELQRLVVGADSVRLRATKGSTVQEAFTRVDWNGQRFLQVEVEDVSAADARAVSLELDGDTVVGVSARDEERLEAGRVRHLAGPAGGKGALLYLAVRVD